MEQDTMGVKREKYWSELSQDEKIERQRQLIKSLQAEIRALSSSFYDFQIAYEQHSHRADKIVVPYSRYKMGQPTSPLGGLNIRLLDDKDKDEVYF